MMNQYWIDGTRAVDDSSVSDSAVGANVGDIVGRVVIDEQQDEEFVDQLSIHKVKDQNCNNIDHLELFTKQCKLC